MSVPCGASSKWLMKMPKRAEPAKSPRRCCFHRALVGYCSASCESTNLYLSLPEALQLIRHFTKCLTELHIRHRLVAEEGFQEGKEVDLVVLTQRLVPPGHLHVSSVCSYIPPSPPSTVAWLTVHSGGLFFLKEIIKFASQFSIMFFTLCHSLKNMVNLGPYWIVFLYCIFSQTGLCHKMCWKTLSDASLEAVSV